jgi:trehalose synthase
LDLQPMAVGARPPGDYAPAAGARALASLAAAAEPLRGARILHVSPAGTAGRVPELLGSMLPLAAGSEIEVEWRVLFGTSEERAVAGALQSGLRGAESAIEPEAWERFAEGCERAARELAGGWDAVVLHDSALPLVAGLEAPAVWRCHDDLARAEADAVELVRPLHERCRLTLVPHESFAPPAFRDDRLAAAAPGIDPLDPRNIELETRLPGRVVRPLGVDLERPFCLQVLELDRWDDPHAAIEAFRVARAEEPELQLVLAGLLDAADSADWQAAKEVSDYLAGGADGVLLLTSYEGLGSLELGALQLLARVVVERSLGEGFELTPCEALWKRTPVVGGTGGGLPLIVRDGVDGFLTNEEPESAARLLELVRDPGLAAEMGRAGREGVRERFLVTGALERELRALADSLGGT